MNGIQKVTGSNPVCSISEGCCGRRGSGSGSSALFRYQTADMAELADAQDLGSCGAIRVGSSPTVRTLQFLLCKFFQKVLDFFGKMIKIVLCVGAEDSAGGGQKWRNWQTRTVQVRVRAIS